MRENKYRAWNKKNKKMIHFDLRSIYGYEGLEGCGVCLPGGHTFLNFNPGYGNKGFNENLDIMQYLGLKDKNRKELYFDDNIKLFAGNTFSDDMTIKDIDDLISLKYLISESGLNFKITGNIHETLKGE